MPTGHIQCLENNLTCSVVFNIFYSYYVHYNELNITHNILMDYYKPT